MIEEDTRYDFDTDTRTCTVPLSCGHVQHALDHICFVGKLPTAYVELGLCRLYGYLGCLGIETTDNASSVDAETNVGLCSRRRHQGIHSPMRYHCTR